VVEGRGWEGRRWEGLEQGGDFQLALVAVADMVDGAKGTWLGLEQIMAGTTRVCYKSVVGSGQLEGTSWTTGELEGGTVEI
jgi:hypothetical protein